MHYISYKFPLYTTPINPPLPQTIRYHPKLISTTQTTPPNPNRPPSHSQMNDLQLSHLFVLWAELKQPRDYEGLEQLAGAMRDYWNDEGITWEVVSDLVRRYGGEVGGGLL